MAKNNSSKRLPPNHPALRHDHIEDLLKTPEHVREASYRRGCHQAVAMALSAIQNKEVGATDPVRFLATLEVVLENMRLTNREQQFPDYMNTAIEAAKCLARRKRSRRATTPAGRSSPPAR